MGIFELINPFSYISPVHADDGESEAVEEVAVVASESIDEPAKEEEEVVFVASDPVEADEEAEVEEEEAVVEEEEEEPVDPAVAIKEG
ncbi:hypothetical protein GGI02_005732, partial [Coemansia sp. RSA 2322]